MSKNENQDQGVNFPKGANVQVQGDWTGRDKIVLGATPGEGIAKVIPIKLLGKEFTKKIGLELTTALIEQYPDMSIGKFYRQDVASVATKLCISLELAETIQSAAFNLMQGT